MNAPSSTIKSAGGYGAFVAGALILLAVFAPEYYDRLPPGAGETLVVIVGTIMGYRQKENVLKIEK